MVAFATAKDLRMKIALAESEKASLALRLQAAADAEKLALYERFSKPAGIGAFLSWD